MTAERGRALGNLHLATEPRDPPVVGARFSRSTWASRCLLIVVAFTVAGTRSPFSASAHACTALTSNERVGAGGCLLAIVKAGDVETYRTLWNRVSAAVGHAMARPRQPRQ